MLKSVLTPSSTQEALTTGDMAAAPGLERVPGTRGQEGDTADTASCPQPLEQHLANFRPLRFIRCKTGKCKTRRRIQILKQGRLVHLRCCGESPAAVPGAYRACAGAIWYPAALCTDPCTPRVSQTAPGTCLETEYSSKV